MRIGSLWQLPSQVFALGHTPKDFLLNVWDGEHFDSLNLFMMEMIKDILKNHPTFKQDNLEKVNNCIQECLTCLSVCKICADACLSEDNASELTECIKKNLACADGNNGFINFNILSRTSANTYDLN